MRKYILVIALFAIGLTSKAQVFNDSTEVTIGIQARDLEALSGVIYQIEDLENLVDSMRVVYRKANNPSATTVLQVKGYTKDWIESLKHFRNNITLRGNECDKRLKALLLALNNEYITGIITAQDASEQTQFIAMRKYGQYRLTRKKTP